MLTRRRGDSSLKGWWQFLVLLSLLGCDKAPETVIRREQTQTQPTAAIKDNHELPNSAFRVAWERDTVPTTAGPNQPIPVEITFKNTGSTTWPNRSPDQAAGFIRAVRLGNRWFRRGEAKPVIGYDQGERFLLPKPLAPNESASLTLRVKTPPNPGDYELQIDLVQEHVAWFEGKGAAILRRPVHVQ